MAPGTIGSDYAPPLIFGVLLVVVLCVVLSEIAEGGIDSEALAMLGVLSAVNAALRPLGAGTAGIETVFFVLVLGGRVYGPGFGFTLGCTSLFASALITGGVGPWMPYQMFGCAFVGMLAGLLPRVTGRRDCPSPSSGSATSPSTWPRPSAGTPGGPSPTSSASCSRARRCSPRSAERHAGPDP